MKALPNTTHVLLCVMFSIIMGVFLCGIPQRASAQGIPAVVPVGDLVNLKFHAGGFTKEMTLDGIAFMVAKAAANQVVASTVDWIGSGFNGSPAFVQNEGRYAQNAVDRMFVDFISNDVAQKYDAAPFRNELIRSLVSEYTSGYSQQKYDLNQHVGDVDAFLGGKASEGGLSGWYALTQNPNNNLYGAKLETKAEAVHRSSAIRTQINTELNRNDGYFSLRDANGNITTPGKLIADQLNQQLGSGQRQLEEADEFSEVISGLINQLTSAVIQQGISTISNQVDDVFNEATLDISNAIEDETGIDLDLNDIIDDAVQQTQRPSTNSSEDN